MSRYIYQINPVSRNTTITYLRPRSISWTQTEWELYILPRHYWRSGVYHANHILFHGIHLTLGLTLGLTPDAENAKRYVPPFVHKTIILIVHFYHFNFSFFRLVGVFCSWYFFHACFANFVHIFLDGLIPNFFFFLHSFTKFFIKIFSDTIF